MTTFTKLLDEIIAHGSWRTRESFASASGASKSYLSEIFHGARLPTQDALAAWCKNAGVAPEDTRRLVYLLARDKALKSPDTAAFVDAADDRIRELRKIVGRLSDLIVKKGLDVPNELLKRIEAFDVKD